jgi:hypothetical protein
VAQLYRNDPEGGLISNPTAKEALTLRASELMPEGVPAYTSVIAYPKISKLITQYGRSIMWKAMVMLLKDFSDSFGVVRNMNEAQMLDAATMLLDECGTFRMEDYVMMFTLAKRGRLDLNDGKGIMDRIDLETIGKIITAYYAKREAAADAMYAAQDRDDHNAAMGASLPEATPAGKWVLKWDLLFKRPYYVWDDGFVPAWRIRQWKADLAKNAQRMKSESKEARAIRLEQRKAEKEQQLRDYCQRTGQNYEALIARQAEERQATMQPFPEAFDQFLNQSKEYHIHERQRKTG